MCQVIERLHKLELQNTEKINSNSLFCRAEFSLVWFDMDGNDTIHNQHVYSATTIWSADFCRFDYITDDIFDRTIACKWLLLVI